MDTTMTFNIMFAIAAVMPLKEPVAFFQTSKEEKTQLWHNRFAHLNFNGLRTLHSKKMVEGLSLLAAPLKVCTNCLAGKQHRNNIPKKSYWRATCKLQLVHSDIYGPVTPESNSGKRYLIIFIDDFSKKC